MDIGNGSNKYKNIARAYLVANETVPNPPAQLSREGWTLFSIFGAPVLKMPDVPSSRVIYLGKVIPVLAVPITLDGNGHTIDGAANIVLTGGERLAIQFNGTEWRTIL